MHPVQFFMVFPAQDLICGTDGISDKSNIWNIFQFNFACPRSKFYSYIFVNFSPIAYQEKSDVTFFFKLSFPERNTILIIQLGYFFQKPQYSFYGLHWGHNLEEMSIQWDPYLHLPLLKLQQQ